MAQAAASNIPTPIRSAPGSGMATPTRIPRRRMGGTMAYSPPTEMNDEPGTPGPVKARINNLNGQVQELVRKQHTTERKHRAEMMTLERRLEERNQQMLQMKIDLSEGNKRAVNAERELERCKAETTDMREELNLDSLVQQQKAILAMSEEKLLILELEQRLVQSEMGGVLRDHKVTLFQSREADLASQLKEKADRVAELEAELASANTSLAHQRAAENKAKALVSSAQGDAQAEISVLEAKVTALESKLAAATALNDKRAIQNENDKVLSDILAVKEAEVDELQATVTKLVEKRRALKEKYQGACAEIEQLQQAQDNAESSEEVTELRAQLRAAKSAASKQADDAADAQAEMKLSKEREKALKAKFQAAQEEQLRLAGIEEELAVLKLAASRKASGKGSPTIESDAEPSSPPKKKAGNTKKTSAETNQESSSSPKKKAGRPKKIASEPSSPAKEKPVSKSRVRKNSPAEEDEDSQPKPKAKKSKKTKENDKEEDEESQPKPKAKKSKAKKDDKEIAPLSESQAENTTSISEKATEDDDAPVPAKKKKRKLFAAQPPAFTWDPILNSGDGVIPAYLSPVKTSARSTASIPRAGFSSLSGRRF